MDALYEKLADAIEKSNKAYDIPRIRAAYELAKKAHEGQMRSSGDPYISHPIEVAVILVGLGMDSDTIIGGLLHDVVEDTTVTLEDIEKQFGGDVAELVDGVTKLANIPYSSRAEQQAENVRKMLLAMAKDVRVVIIKLADRLHNMRTLDYRIPEKQRVKSLETMEIYAPLAHRLGIRSVKEELEDLSLKHLDPVAYHEIEQQLALRKEDREAFLSNIIKRIQARLEEEHVTAQIDGRVKSIYGIYRKMYIQGRSFDEIYDIYAVRIIVDTNNPDEGTTGVTYPGYTMWNLTLTQGIWKGVSLNMAVNNIFNYVPSYYDANSPYTRGSNFSIGLALDVDRFFRK